MMNNEIKTDLKEKEAKLPYEKPELIELGSVEHATATGSRGDVYFG